MADLRELDKQENRRYNSVYCGICRGIRQRSGSMARFVLSYDMAFLALLLMSLYEPEEVSGKRACGFHPISPHPWVENQYVKYGADMNVALAYYKALDDYQDEGHAGAKRRAEALGKQMAAIEAAYPRQCRAMADCMAALGRLEKENCPNLDETAGAFGQLMAELLVYQEDLWAEDLRQMGMALGRFIYLADAAIDYKKDRRKGSFNPFLAADTGEAPELWEQYLVLAMGRCTEHYERLPLVQDKKILDNILYSGIWVEYRRRHSGRRREEEQDDQ